jgi:hypothetical protein
MQEEEYSVQEPTVLYEGPSILFGKQQSSVFKMWHTCGWSQGNICYAESTDGSHFVRYNGGKPIISGTGRSFVLRLGTTYYLFTTQEVNGVAWDRYESSDGIQWKLTFPRVLTLGSAPWEKVCGNIFVWIENSTWYAMYEAGSTDGTWRVGLATSPDGISWTKNATNPVISKPSCGGPEIHKINGTYYMWAQCSSQTRTIPDDIYRWRSNDLLTWTPEVVEIRRQTPDEGSPDNDQSQVADPSMVEVNGAVYLYYDATPTQYPNSTGAIHIKVAVAKMNFSSLVKAPSSPNLPVDPAAVSLFISWRRKPR